MFTFAQQFSLAFAPKISSLISILSSSFVIVEIIRSPERRSRLYHRLVLCMNICQSIQSCCHFTGTWAMPNDTRETVGAIGNNFTCKTQAFLLSSPGTCVPIYYSLLSVLSYVAIKNDFDEKKYKKLEPAIHIIAIVIPFTLSVTGLLFGFFHPAGGWCWVDSHPLYCELDPNVECEILIHPYYRTAVSYISLFFGCGMTLVTMLIYYEVKKQEKKSNSSTVAYSRTKSRIVLLQCGLYLIVCILSYFGSYVARMIQWKQRRVIYPLHMVSTILITLQGFFNMVVYLFLRNTAKNRSIVHNAPFRSMDTMSNSRNASNMIQGNEFSIFDGSRSNAVSSESNEISDVQMDDEVILTASVTYVNE